MKTRLRGEQSCYEAGTWATINRNYFRRLLYFFLTAYSLHQIVTGFVFFFTLRSRRKDCVSFILLLILTIF